jgi:hypothetical protein
VRALLDLWISGGLLLLWHINAVTGGQLQTLHISRRKELVFLLQVNPNPNKRCCLLLPSHVSSLLLSAGLSGEEEEGDVVMALVAWKWLWGSVVFATSSAVPK